MSNGWFKLKSQLEFSCKSTDEFNTRRKVLMVYDIEKMEISE